MSKNQLNHCACGFFHVNFRAPIKNKVKDFQSGTVIGMTGIPQSFQFHSTGNRSTILASKSEQLHASMYCKFVKFHSTSNKQTIPYTPITPSKLISCIYRVRSPELNGTTGAPGQHHGSTHHHRPGTCPGFGCRPRVPLASPPLRSSPTTPQGGA